MPVRDTGPLRAAPVPRRNQRHDRAEIQTAFTHQLTPILCVGDTLEQHHAGRSEEAVQAQLAVLLRDYHRTGGPFLIAYEPAWAISTSSEPRECKPDEAGDRHSFIRSVIATELGENVAADTTLLFGGSVTAGNADAYFTRTDIDGGLVGAASQELTSFQALIEASVTTYGQPRPGAGHKIDDRSTPSITSRHTAPRRGGAAASRRDSP
ncbi:MAG TPA: triose-phosphate isomerase [Dermatophilaceae bacterium]|nr:triose-phosphate isomerase [Dermatophilaceae bacterium]